VRTIAEVLTLATQFLADHHIERSRRCAEDLLSFVLKMKRLDLYMQFDRPLVEMEMAEMRSFLKRSVAGEPTAYILGEIDFMGCCIQVTPDVLIPRQETEILVDMALKKIKETLERTGRSDGVCWDLCTGSGCIGLGVKLGYPKLTVVLSDICPKALRMAELNSINNHLQVECRLGDLLQPFLNEKADFVFCNPPYVSINEFDSLEKSVRNFEPSLALLGGCNGTDFYERLSVELPNHLNQGAQVFFEIGHAQAAAIQEIFSKPPWREGRIFKDWSGHDRFFFLEIE